LKVSYLLVHHRLVQVQLRSDNPKEKECKVQYK
jgi:hypothetical protein